MREGRRGVLFLSFFGVKYCLSDEKIRNGGNSVAVEVELIRTDTAFFLVLAEM